MSRFVCGSLVSIILAVASSALGGPVLPDWTAASGALGAQAGNSVCTAGGINGDGATNLLDSMILSRWVHGGITPPPDDSRLFRWCLGVAGWRIMPPSDTPK